MCHRDTSSFQTRRDRETGRVKFFFFSFILPWAFWESSQKLRRIVGILSVSPKLSSRLQLTIQEISSPRVFTLSRPNSSLRGDRADLYLAKSTQNEGDPIKRNHRISSLKCTSKCAPDSPLETFDFHRPFQFCQPPTPPYKNLTFTILFVCVQET